MFRAPRLQAWPWMLIIVAFLLNLIGVAFVYSASLEVGWQPERVAVMQVVWLCLSLITAAMVSLIKIEFWRNIAPAAYAAIFFIQAGMVILAGTGLVPTIKGAHNWIALGSIRIQPSEFYKIATLLMVAWLVALRLDARNPKHALLIAGVGMVPAILIAKEDLGSALTFGPMVFGMLIAAGMSLRLIAGLGAVGTAGVLSVIPLLPREGYQARRLAAWLRPEEYALTEGFQTMRALRSIGSGQWKGKGFAAGEQNQLGWLPEQHTDMIFAVIGEETGLLGCTAVLVLCVLLVAAGLIQAGRTPNPFARMILVGFTLHWRVR